MKKSVKKKGAIELSMSTIVILVLAMSMLILGLVLIKSIFSGAKYNVDTINDKVQGEIEKLFVENDRVVVYLANQEFDASQGGSYGIAFGIKNLITGVPGTSKFSYDVSINNPDEVKSNCGLRDGSEPLSWIKAGKSGSLNILPNQVKADVIKFQIPAGAPSCIIRYTINVKDPTDPSLGYDSINFDANIK
jgi:hypothetical protein